VETETPAGAARSGDRHLEIIPTFQNDEANMNKQHSQWTKYFALALGLCLAATASGQQNQRGGTGGNRGNTGGGGFGGFGGFGGAGNTTGGTSSRQGTGNNSVGEAIITSDPETRRLIIVTDDETSQYITEVINSLDRPKPQVLIKVVFMEVTHSDGSDIGIEGGFKEGSGNGANVFGLSALNQVATNVQVNSLGQPTQSFIPTPPGAGLYQIINQDYQVTLRAIAQAGKAKILSRPSILARNNQPATILVGQSVPLVTSTSYSQNGFPINAFTYSDVGIILRVTPFITSDNLVEMILAPEISSISKTESITVSPGVTAPVIDRRSADTVVVTPDGQTVIIGGLIANQKSESVSKIPFLGDIPYLGVAFRSTQKKDVKTELLIFLTPRIVQAPGQLAALTTKEKDQSDLNKAYTEAELEKFLNELPTTQEKIKPKSPPKSFLP
jgi:general secretion pathway protein D